MGNSLFYRELGKLLYAIAAADNNITSAERKSLSNEITQRLLHKERSTDAYGTNKAWDTQFSFETTEDQGTTVDEAFDEFLDYIKTYKNQLKEDEVDICLKLADHIADSYHHINKKENKLLAQLRQALMQMRAAQLIF
jgi:hypothetical protein